MSIDMKFLLYILVLSIVLGPKATVGAGMSAVW